MDDLTPLHALFERGADRCGGVVVRKRGDVVLTQGEASGSGFADLGAILYTGCPRAPGPGSRIQRHILTRQ
jgi:hypothetical protein